MLDTIFLICFGFGTAFSVLAALLHLVGGGLDVPGLDSFEGGWVITKFASPTAILAGLIGFGGAGHVALSVGAWAAPLALLAAGASGLALALPTGMFVHRLRQDTGLLLHASVDGLPALVTVRIPEGGVGEIQFERRGIRASEAARGVKGQGFDTGVEVAIVGYHDGMAEVASLGLEEGEGQIEGPPAGQRSLPEGPQSHAQPQVQSPAAEEA